MLFSERLRRREREALERWKESSRAKSVMTDLVERLRPHFGYIDRTFEYELRDGRLHQQEECFETFLQNGQRISERLRHTSWQWAIEHERNVAETIEGQKVTALARGEYPPGTMLVTISGAPEPVHQGHDVLAYRASEPVALVRFWRKTEHGVSGRTISCEGSSPLALAAAVQEIAGRAAAEQFAQLSTTDAIANPLDIMESDDIAERFIAAYDDTLTALTGKEVQYGVPLERLAVARELNVLLMQPRYRPKLEEAYRRVFMLDYRIMDATTRQYEYDKIMQEIPAAVRELVENPELAVNDVSSKAAGARASAAGVSFRPGCPTAPTGTQAMSAQFGREAMSYRYVIDGECRACLKKKPLPPEGEGCGVCQSCTEFDNQGGDLMKVRAAAVKQRLAATAQRTVPPQAPAKRESLRTKRPQLRVVPIFGGARQEVFDQGAQQWRPATRADLAA